MDLSIKVMSLKSELESADIDLIVDRIIEKIKPVLSSNAKQNTEDRILNKKELAKYLNVDISWINKKVPGIPPEIVPIVVRV